MPAVPQGVDSAKIVKTAYAKYNLSIGVGLSKVAGKVFRIGHLGNCDEVMSASALAGTPLAIPLCLSLSRQRKNGRLAGEECRNCE